MLITPVFREGLIFNDDFLAENTCVLTVSKYQNSRRLQILEIEYYLSGSATRLQPKYLVNNVLQLIVSVSI